MSKIDGPQAQEFQHEGLVNGNICQDIDFGDHPEPENIEGRVVSVEFFEATVGQFLDPIGPIALVAAKSGGVGA